MKGYLERIGSRLIRFDEILGEMVILLGQMLYFFREAPRNIQSILTQMAIIGYETLPVASVMAFFVGDGALRCRPVSNFRPVGGGRLGGECCLEGRDPPPLRQE